MADKFRFSKYQLQTLIFDNRYSVNEKTKYISRCIDGRYPNEKDLPALAIAGADAGELAVIYSAANQYGFEVVPEKVFATLVEIVGGMKNFQLHTDGHGEKDLAASGCGHMKQMRLDPKAYNLEHDQVELLNKQMSQAKEQGAEEVMLTGNHQEGAVAIVTGNYGVLPQYRLQTDAGSVFTELFIHHKTLVDARHKALAEKLIANGAVKLYDNLDSEYLYEVLSTTSDDHLLETAKRLAATLPLYAVNFKDDGEFEIEERGFI